MTRFLLPFTLLCGLLALPASASAATRLNGTERALVHEVNGVRAQYGLPQVRAARRLQRTADRHSGDMLRHDFFDHPSSDGTPMHVRVRRAVGNAAVGETLAITGPAAGAATVVQMWMNSPGHRAILLERGFRRIGIGRRSGSFGGHRESLWTADFASRR